jgi:predicted XRE-type DNA-binding protein
MSNEETAVYQSSDNIFADLGRPDAEEAFARIKLAKQIADVVMSRKLTQLEAAAIMGLDQPKVSALMRGRLAGFSLDRLLRCLTLLGQDVEIIITDKGSNSHLPAHISVIAPSLAAMMNETQGLHRHT